MSATSNLITLVVLGGAAAIGLAIFKAKMTKVGGDGAAKFKVKTLLTANELEFMRRLESAAPELRFSAQVSMGALLDPAVPRSDAKAYYRLRGMFTAQAKARRTARQPLPTHGALDNRQDRDRGDARHDRAGPTARLTLPLVVFFALRRWAAGFGALQCNYGRLL